MTISFNTDKLNSLELGRLNQQLNKKWNFSEAGIMSMKEYILKINPVSKCKQVLSHSKKRVNLEYKELKNAKTEYLLKINDRSFFEVPKIIYDSIQIPEVSE